MKDKISYFYSIFDKESKSFGPISEFSSNAVAIRAFKQSFKDKLDWVADFDLYCLGDRCQCDSTDDYSTILSLSFGWHVPELVFSGVSLPDILKDA